MSVLWLREAQVSAIVEHARAEAPNEACGLLLGASMRVIDTVPAKNVAENPPSQYEIDPLVISRHLKQIIGFYHSHPNGKPIPSRSDIESAWQDDSVYLIVGLERGQCRLAAWKIRRTQVESVEIYTGDDPPVQTHPLSQSHKAVIILSGVVALGLFLIIALSLLPPAPPIP